MIIFKHSLHSLFEYLSWSNCLNAIVYHVYLELWIHDALWNIVHNYESPWSTHVHSNHWSQKTIKNPFKRHAI